MYLELQLGSQPELRLGSQPELQLRIKLKVNLKPSYTLHIECRASAGQIVSFDLGST